jgi:riboflavin biosynthesis pyrimidine reductase
MRELIVTQNITLDGVIDAAEGWFDASGEEGVDQSDVVEAVREEIATTDALLVGRVTFEQLRVPLLDEVRELKAQPGKGIVVTGSMSLMPELIAGGVVDEYRLFVYPVVLGHGQRLFADATNVPRLHLAEARRFRSGIVLLRYRTA